MLVTAVGTSSASATRELKCDECEKNYFYMITRTVSVEMSGDPLQMAGVHNAGMRDYAKGVAANRLDREVNHAPCPYCGNIPREMARKLKQQKHAAALPAFLLSLVVFIIAYMFASMLGSFPYMSYARIANPEPLLPEKSYQELMQMPPRERDDYKWKRLTYSPPPHPAWVWVPASLSLAFMACGSVPLFFYGRRYLRAMRFDPKSEPQQHRMRLAERNSLTREQYHAILRQDASYAIATLQAPWHPRDYAAVTAREEAVQTLRSLAKKLDDPSLLSFIPDPNVASFILQPLPASSVGPQHATPVKEPTRPNPFQFG